MTRGLAAALPLEPALKGLLERMDDPAIAIAFAQRRGDSMRAGLAKARGHDLPFVRVFNHRLGGGRALALLLSRDTGDAPFATAPVPFALDEIVAHCGISRVQARRLFDEALAEGLVTIDNGRLTWLEPSRRHIIYGTPFEFASNLVSAAAMVSEMPEMFATAEPV